MPERGLDPFLHRWDSERSLFHIFPCLAEYEGIPDSAAGEHDAVEPIVLDERARVLRGEDIARAIYEDIISPEMLRKDPERASVRHA